MKERDIDCMKYRKSTHLASVDVEAIIESVGKCILTIKDVYYSKGVDVSGNNTDAYFIDFLEDVKSMVVNSTNRKIISELVKNKNGFTAPQSRKINNWIGMKIELYVDEKVKNMGKIVSGIRVKKEPVLIRLQQMPAEKMNDAFLSIKEGKTTLEAIKKHYHLSDDQEKALSL